ncbi:sensor histidine kinase [Paenibacillus farraposensis]|uniref:histidine kinase n=1 Tax=Paenibacillus farraposensis TaxID=2807095 RepID=A0ABW4DJH2_9BACL|nr:sensor histidine kinase [Paenibacillus farraposensis]MCC3379660.1 sensor histidine kinase [Paenibacillus farraposensis]
MRMLRTTLDHVRLRDKMLLLYFLCVFIPVVLTNLIFYHVTSQNVKEQRMQDISRALEQIKIEFYREFEDAMEISSILYIDHQLNELLELAYPHPADYIAAYDSYLRHMLNNTYSPVYHSVGGITIYTDNPTLLNSGGINLIDERVKSLPWYSKIPPGRQSKPIFVRTGDGTGEQQHPFSLIRRMNYFYSQNGHEKILKIELRMSSIREIFHNLNLQGSLFLLNERGEIEYTTDPKVDTNAKAVAYNELQLPKDTIEFKTNYVLMNSLNGWSIVAAMPEDEVLYEMQTSRNFVLLLTCANMLLPTLIIIWITRSLNVRIHRILKHMKKVKNQRFELIPGTVSRDEIGQLTGEFNRMTLKIKRLINDVYVADIQRKNVEIQRRHAQLNALHSQINPHFLFNALETIRMRSLMKREDETAHIIHNMARIFRNSLVWNKDRVTLREELELISCFLEIQQYRFGERIGHEVQAQPEDLDYLLPKMVVLTLVENASIHGIEPLKHGGRIEIHFELRAGRLILTVRDNGVGMSVKQVQRLYNYMQRQEEMGERIGLQNVIYRLKLYYGSRFELNIRSALGEGTEIRIMIPADRE